MLAQNVMTDQFTFLKLKFGRARLSAVEGGAKTHFFRNININSILTIKPRVQGNFSTRMSPDLYFSHIFTECKVFTHLSALYH